jgi:glyceraldehyde 3-phosphate dehydrogenase
VQPLHEKLGVVTGLMTTIHAYTNDQNVLDQAHKDPRRARAAALNMIPTSTGAASAVGLVLPELKGILGFTTAPNVSIDFNHDPHSSVFHMDQTNVMDGTFVRVMAWYDNEWGFSNRMSDTAVAMGKLL